MKRIFITIAACFIAVTAMAGNPDTAARTAQGERIIFTSAENPVFYAHGCDAFQYNDLTPGEVLQLSASGSCSVEAHADDATKLKLVGGVYATVNETDHRVCYGNNASGWSCNK